jgi:hypothetical protein
LQGKSEPDASRGEFVRDDFPYGMGVFMIMCELPRTAKPKATVDVVKCMLMDFFVPDEDSFLVERVYFRRIDGVVSWDDVVVFVFV